MAANASLNSNVARIKNGVTVDAHAKKALLQDAQVIAFGVIGTADVFVNQDGVPKEHGSINSHTQKLHIVVVKNDQDQNQHYSLLRTE